MPNGQQRTGPRAQRPVPHRCPSASTTIGSTTWVVDVRWTPEELAVTDAGGDMYGGAARFSYRMAPLNIKGRDADRDASGRNTKTWTSRHSAISWSIRRDPPRRPCVGHQSSRVADTAAIAITPAADRCASRRPGESVLMTRDMPLDRIAARTARGRGCRSIQPADADRAGAGRRRDRLCVGPEWIDIEPSRLATESTLGRSRGTHEIRRASRICRFTSRAPTGRRATVSSRAC